MYNFCSHIFCYWKKIYILNTEVKNRSFAKCRIDYVTFLGSLSLENLTYQLVESYTVLYCRCIQMIFRWYTGVFLLPICRKRSANRPKKIGKYFMRFIGLVQLCYEDYPVSTLPIWIYYLLYLWFIPSPFQWDEKMYNT